MMNLYEVIKLIIKGEKKLVIRMTRTTYMSKKKNYTII